MCAAAATDTLRVGMLVGSTNAAQGVLEVVRSLALALERRGNVHVEIFSLAEEAEPPIDLGSIPVHVAPVLGPKAFSFAPDLVKMMHRSELDCVHVHGMWNYLSIAARRWHQLAKRPYIVSPHGMLDHWPPPVAGMRRRVAEFLFENAHIRSAAAVHAVSPAERRSLREAGYDTPTDVIPNGVEPADQRGPAAEWLAPLGPDARVLLFLGRIMPNKGLGTLLSGWRRAMGGAGSEGWHLVFVGPSEGSHVAELQALADDLGVTDNVHFVGPAYGADRAAAYRSADAYVLPSVSETLPMTALEAFAFQLPCLLTPQCNLPEAFARSAAIRIEPTEASIAEGLARLFSLTPMERSRMGQAAYDLADARFDWDLAAARFEQLYAAVLSQQRAMNAA